VWQPAERIYKYDQMDDAVLRFIYRVCRKKPMLRVQGEYAPLDVAMEEPARTERMLARAEWLGMKRYIVALCCWPCAIVKERAKPRQRHDRRKEADGEHEPSSTKDLMALPPSMPLPTTLGKEQGEIGGMEKPGRRLALTRRWRASRCGFLERLANRWLGQRGEVPLKTKQKCAAAIQARYRGNQARLFVEDLRMYAQEIQEAEEERRERGEESSGDISFWKALDRAKKELAPAYFREWRPPPLDEEEAEDAGAMYEELSVWFEAGRGDTWRGTFWQLGATLLQILMTLAISLFAVVGETYTWARRGSLILMIALQGTMAWWAAYGDGIDLLTNIVNTLVSVLELLATSLLLIMDYTREAASEEALTTMGTISGNVLMASAFVPTILSVYDSMFLPIAESLQARMAEGKGCCGAVGDVIKTSILAIPALMGLDLADKMVNEANSSVDQESRQTTRRRHRDRYSKRESRAQTAPIDVKDLHSYDDDEHGYAREEKFMEEDSKTAISYSGSATTIGAPAPGPAQASASGAQSSGWGEQPSEGPRKSVTLQLVRPEASALVSDPSKDAPSSERSQGVSDRGDTSSRRLLLEAKRQVLEAKRQELLARKKDPPAREALAPQGGDEDAGDAATKLVA